MSGSPILPPGLIPVPLKGAVLLLTAVGFAAVFLGSDGGPR